MSNPSIRVEGIKPPDDKWRQMKSIYDSCESAGIDLPVEVEDYFDGEEPDDEGQITKVPWGNYKADMEEGLEVKVEDIPRSVKIIRFVVNYD